MIARFGATLRRLLRGAALKPGTKVGVTGTAVNTVEGKIDLSLARKTQEKA